MGILYRYHDPLVSYHHTVDSTPVPSSFSMHAHENHEIYYFISGKASYIVEGNEYHLEGGSLMIMSAGEVHKPSICSGHVYERMALNFDENLLQGVDPQGLLLRPFLDRPLGMRNLYPRSLLHSGFVYECMREIECAGNEQEQRVTLLSNLFPILSEIYRVFRLNEGPEDPQPSDRVQEIITYINEHLDEELSLDSLTKQFYVSKPQLGRLFKRATGSSVWEYVLVKRLMLARQLLRRGEPALSVCQQCGFRDYSAFYRAYRKRYGCSPQEEKGRS